MRFSWDEVNEGLSSKSSSLVIPLEMRYYLPSKNTKPTYLLTISQHRPIRRITLISARKKLPMKSPSQWRLFNQVYHDGGKSQA